MSVKILLLPVIGAATFFILLFTFTKVFGPIPFSVNSVSTTKNDTFNVAGEGKVTATPDVAIVTVGVLANGASVKAAQDQINLAINKVTEAVKSVGIDAKDIQTTNYSINPNYDYNSGSQRIIGYQASTNLAIKVRDITQVNDVIDQSTKNGANQVGGIVFEVDDKTALQNEARKKAVAKAKAKAQNAAEIAGFSLGKIVNYNENFGGGFPTPMVSRVFAAGSVSDEKLQTNIEPGSSEIIVNVTLSYEIY